MKLTPKEIKVIIGMINSEQWDGASWTINDVNLNKLRDKLKKK